MVNRREAKHFMLPGPLSTTVCRKVLHFLSDSVIVIDSSSVYSSQSSPRLRVTLRFSLT